MAKTRPLKTEPSEPPDSILSEPAHRRMIIGASREARIGAVCYVVTLIGFAVTLGRLFEGREFGVVDIGFMYFGWGVFGGALGGLSIPMARGPMSSIPVAALIFFPLAIAVRVMTHGWSAWTMRGVLLVLASSFLMGLLWGPLA